ncbi:26845_t:CDS:2, partial [Racocetra persica]
MLKNTQEEINKKNNHATSRGQLLEPIATISSMYLNSVFVLLEHLLLLYESIQLLVKKMVQNADREICKDRKKLEALLLNKEELLGLKELISLLELFVCVTCLIGGNTYPIFSLIFPTIATLQEYLFKLEKILTHQEDLKIEGYLAAILDPHFKNLKFAPENFKETKQYLKQKMIALDENEYLEEQPT